MAMAQTAFRTRPSFYRHSMAEARWSHRAEKPLFQAFFCPSSLKITDWLCIKDGTTIEAAEGSGGVFTRVIEKYYKGRRDRKTVEILGKE